MIQPTSLFLKNVTTFRIAFSKGNPWPDRGNVTSATSRITEASRQMPNKFGITVSIETGLSPPPSVALDGTIQTCQGPEWNLPRLNTFTIDKKSSAAGFDAAV